jgi:hypothetical protein
MGKQKQSGFSREFLVKRGKVGQKFDDKKVNTLASNTLASNTLALASNTLAPKATLFAMGQSNRRGAA